MSLLETRCSAVWRVELLFAVKLLQNQMSNKLRASKQKHQRRSGFIKFVFFFVFFFTPGSVSLDAACVFISSSCNRPVSPVWMLQRVCVKIKQSARHCLWRLKEICTLLSEQQTSHLTSRDIFLNKRISLCCVFYRGSSTLSLTLRPPKHETRGWNWSSFTLLTKSRRERKEGMFFFLQGQHFSFSGKTPVRSHWRTMFGKQLCPSCSLRIDWVMLCC